jgi:hypothetical protein
MLLALVIRCTAELAERLQRLRSLPAVRGRERSIAARALASGRIRRDEVEFALLERLNYDDDLENVAARLGASVDDVLIAALFHLDETAAAYGHAKALARVAAGH